MYCLVTISTQICRYVFKNPKYVNILCVYNKNIDVKKINAKSKIIKYFILSYKRLLLYFYVRYTNAFRISGVLEK